MINFSDDRGSCAPQTLTEREVLSAKCAESIKGKHKNPPVTDMVLYMKTY